MMKHKMVIVMRTDLNMRKGKMVAQGAHAACMAFLGCAVHADYEKILQEWIEDSGMVKVCVGVPSLELLVQAVDDARAQGIFAQMVVDAGITEFKGVPTPTCAVIGPDLVEKVDQITGWLRLL